MAKIKVLWIIPARWGSKWIPLKNIRLLKNRPLIEYTISAAKKSWIFDEICISTDNEKIGGFASKHKIDYIKRPNEISWDYSTSIETVIHSLNQYQKNWKVFDVVILLQPTSPLRTSTHIKESYKKFINSWCKSLYSITECEKHPYKSFISLEDGHSLKPMYGSEFLSKPRQELPRVYNQNWAIYINYSKDIIKHQDFYIEPICWYIMEKSDSIDIDDLSDLELANIYLDKKND